MLPLELPGPSSEGLSIVFEKEICLEVPFIPPRASTAPKQFLLKGRSQAFAPPLLPSCHSLIGRGLPRCVESLKLAATIHQGGFSRDRAAENH